ncbi:hypothetical protein M758_4G084000, partial [Ceratodon purpureus]
GSGGGEAEAAGGGAKWGREKEPGVRGSAFRVGVLPPFGTRTRTTSAGRLCVKPLHASPSPFPWSFRSQQLATTPPSLRFKVRCLRRFWSRVGMVAVVVFLVLILEREGLRLEGLGFEVDGNWRGCCDFECLVLNWSSGGRCR